MFTTFCCCKRPLCTWKVDNFHHEEPSLPLKSCTLSSFPSESITASWSVSSSLESVTMGFSSLYTADGGALFPKGSSLSQSSPLEQSDLISCKRCKAWWAVNRLIIFAVLICFRSTVCLALPTTQAANWIWIGEILCYFSRYP